MAGPPGPDSAGAAAEVRWQLPPPDEWRSCPVCARALSWRELDGFARRACARCGFVFWAYPWPSVVALVRDPAGRILVTRRRYPPEPGGMCLPGGHMESGEDPESAVRREVAEETGIDARSPSLLAVLPTLRRTGLVLFYALEAGAEEPTPGSDALEAAFVVPGRLPELCFETHREIVRRFARP